MTFYEWMMIQVGRNDEIGDLAGDMITVNEARAMAGKYKATNHAIF